jgi:hypothetical protein
VSAGRFARKRPDRAPALAVREAPAPGSLTGMFPALILALVAAAPVQEEQAPTAAFPELGLKLELPELARFESQGPGEQVVGRWSGRLGNAKVQIVLRVLPRAQFGFGEPEDVSQLLEWNFGEESEADGFAFSRAELVEGPYGHAPYASLVTCDLTDDDGDVVERFYALCGLLEQHGYAVEVRASPPPDEASEQTLLAFLRGGVRYSGEVRDPRWSEDEVLARWREYAPEDAARDLEKPIRTEHYVILGNSSGGKAFAKAMEEFYDRIREVYPFPEAKGRRLMPVFLFRTPDQYYAYYSKIAEIDLEEARKSKGHSWRDYYATWYEAPKDPVHIHEATHQIFANRLGLSGGGSWLQEGVAEFISSRSNELNDIARVVKKGEHTPLRKFVAIPSLLGSAKKDIKGGNEAGDHYAQAALLIEFLREGRFGKGKFERFLHTVGRLPRGKVERIDAAIRAIYGVDLDGLDAEFQAWAKKR